MKLKVMLLTLAINFYNFFLTVIYQIALYRIGIIGYNRTKINSYDLEPVLNSYCLKLWKYNLLIDVSICLLFTLFLEQYERNFFPQENDQAIAFSPLCSLLIEIYRLQGGGHEYFCVFLN